MTEKFIKNEQLNFIKKQINLIKDSTKKNVPPNVLTAVIDLANAKIADLFPNASLELLSLLDISKLKMDNDYEHFIQQLTDYLIPFPVISEQKIKKLFPKVKKLKMPNLSNVDLSQLTYLSWQDIRANKKFIVYEIDGKLVGIEGEMAPTSKKNLCSFCNSFSEVSYFSTKTKAKKANNPDYYKSIGNLICTDSNECNKQITNIEYLRSFLKESLEKKLMK